MEIVSLHDESKSVELKKFFSGEQGTVSTLQVLKNSEFKRHTSSVPAVLLCIRGHAMYCTDSGQEEEIRSGSYVEIVPELGHWVKGLSDSHFILMK